LLKLLVAAGVRLHVEDVAAVDRVALNLVEDDLAAEVLVSEVEGHFGDSVGFELVCVELAAVVLDDLFDFLVDSVEVVVALGDPLLLTVVLYLEDCLGNHPVHYLRVDFASPFRLTLYQDVHQHGQEEQVLIKGQLVLHVANLGKDLEGHQSQSGEIFSELRLLDLVGEIVIFLED
jgi:hypothetical protein